MLPDTRIVLTGVYPKFAQVRMRGQEGGGGGRRNYGIARLML